MIYVIDKLSNEIKKALLENILNENVSVSIENVYYIRGMAIEKVYYIRETNDGYVYDEKYMHNGYFSDLQHGNVLDLLLKFNIPVVWDISEDSEYNSVRIVDNELYWSSMHWNKFGFGNYLYCNDNTLLYSIEDKEESIYNNVNVEINKGDLVYGRRNGHYIACYYDKYEDNLYYCSDEYGSNPLTFPSITLKIPQKISIIQQNL